MFASKLATRAVARMQPQRRGFVDYLTKWPDTVSVIIWRENVMKIESKSRKVHSDGVVLFESNESKS
jgi:hypothetical protein